NDQVEVRDITKTFGGTSALKNVSATFAGGTVHSLLGGNGSGKSTLIKVLAGVHKADGPGEIRVSGRSYSTDHWGPGMAKAAGIRFVHQNPAVFQSMTVAENLTIGGRFISKGGLINWRKVNTQANITLDRFGIDALATDTMRDLSPANQTLVAIARALSGVAGAEASLLVLDEPTASLPRREVDRLLSSVRSIASAGRAVLYVSHRLDEVLETADVVTVLRDGETVLTRAVPGMAKDDLVEAIVGHVPATPKRSPKARPIGRDLLKLSQVKAGPLKNVNVTVKSGEVLGIAGLLGSGRTAVLKAIYGLLPVDAGGMSLDGQSYDPASPEAAMKAGIGYVPENREEDAALLSLNISENIMIGDYKSIRNFFRVDTKRADEAADEAISKFGIKASGTNSALASLSGGNQQKVILSRWIRRSPNLLLLDEPTQGVDIGARADIHHILRSAADKGMASIVVSSDMSELVSISDRIAVIRGGSFDKIVDASTVSAEQLEKLIHSGGTRNDK
ncbi:MAG: sugar ABC transporter ATP-binding protein, partial [Alcaligenaceae bacterium]